MPRHVSETLTQREAEIMAVLWELGSCTADQIRQALPDAPHDSTVRTLLRVLESKGYARHTARGKAYLYHPAVKRANAERRVLRSVLQRFFGGSAALLVQRLMEDEQLTPEQLERLKEQTDSSG